eukprot:12537136-Prorocentrum_lima.AAC.1
MAPAQDLIIPNHGLQNQHQIHGTLQQAIQDKKGISGRDPGNSIPDTQHPNPERTWTEGWTIRRKREERWT